MALYDRKTERIVKTKSRTKSTKGSTKRASSAAVAQQSEDFVLHSAVDSVEYEGSDDEEEAETLDHVAECEDEIDRLKRRHEEEVGSLRAEVRLDVRQEFEE